MIEDYSETKKKLSLILKNKDNRTERTVHQLALKYIVNGTNLSSALRSLCEEIDNNTYSMSCIMLYDHEKETLSSYSSFSLPLLILNLLTNVKVGPESTSTGVAAYRKKMTRANLQEDLEWLEYRNIIVEHGIMTRYSFPCVSEDGDLLGTCDFYYQVDHQISDQETFVLERYSHIASVIIEAFRFNSSNQPFDQKDSLTKLKNRQQFYEEVKKSAELGIHYYIMFLDIDHFRLINQYYSYETADYVLIEVANRIKKHMGQNSLVGRWNGDQFVVFMPEVTEAECVKSAKQLLKALEKLIIYKDEEILITCSIGISKYNDRDQSLGIKPAEAAMKIAKKKETHRWYMYEESFQGSTIEEELAKAITQGVFELYYQPQIEVLEKRVFGVEALLRWQHPIYGSVSPQLFIQVAEEQGLMDTLGDLVIKKSFQQAKKLIELCPGMKVSINISVIQLNKPTFYDKLVKEIRNNEISAEHVIIEITETAAINNISKIRKVIEKVRSLGIQVAIDDFGTAYSSLKYIKDLPCDILKIDKSFVRDIELDPKNLQIVNLMVELGKRTNIKVSAEGVETWKQMNLLKQLGCNIIQGFYVSKPLSFEELASYLKENKEIFKNDW